jgi:hypothetical protein
MCPGCGTKVERTYDEMFFVSLLFGLLLLPIGLLSFAANPPDSAADWSAFAFFTIIPLSSLLVAVYSMYRLANQKEMHIHHLSGLPPGVIPLENRPGYGDILIKAKRKKERLRRTAPVMRYMKESVPEMKFHELDGDWDFPVLSKEERIEYSKEIQRKMIKSDIVMVFIGLVLLIIGTVVFFFWIIIIVGLIFILISLLFVGVVQWAKKQVHKDITAETKVAWKTIGQKSATDNLAEFMKQYGEEYKIKKISAPKGSFDSNPRYKYEFVNGNYVTSIYNEFGGGMAMAWLAIGYKPATYSQAKKVQLALDKFMGERDLIARSG